LKNFIKNWGSFFLTLLIFWLLWAFVVTPVSVKGHSMDPTLADGQKMITYKLAKINRFDIVTTKEPDDLKKLAVKRVIGLPGDIVEMQDDQLTINEEKIDESYLTEYKNKFTNDRLQDEYAYNTAYQSLAKDSQTFTNTFTYEVPEGKYLLLGDNRLISKDSRIFGFVDKDLIQGEVIFRYWPFSEIAVLHNGK